MCIVHRFIPGRIFILIRWTVSQIYEARMEIYARG